MSAVWKHAVPYLVATLLAVSAPLSTAAEPSAPLPQAAVERSSVAVPMVVEGWGATATSLPPSGPKSQRFLGHMPGYREAKQEANQRAAQNRPSQAISPVPRALSKTLAGPAPLNGPGSLITFEGPSESDTQYIPPDSQIAAGPNHLVVAINSLLAIYDKSGNQLGGYQDLGTFFASLGITGEIFDPRLVYDQVDGRFILSVADVDMTNFTNGYVLLAVSQTSDPTGAWYKYAIDFTGLSPRTGRRTFPDFPGLGLGGNDVYLTTNQFELNAGCLNAEDCAFSDAWIRAIGLPALLTGNPTLDVSTFKNVHAASNQLAFSLQPAVTYGSPGYEFFVAASFSANPNSVLDLFALNFFGTPTLTAAELTVPEYWLPSDALQGGTMTLIMTNDFRTLNAVWANGSLWVGQNVGHFSVLPLARWYEIQLTSLDTAALVQSGDVRGVGGAYFPAISVKADGSVGMSFTTSSPVFAASAGFTGRESADPPGTMRGYAVYRTGTGPYQEQVDNRWGDYSGISEDPDGNSFWTIAEYAGTPNPHFGTAIAQMSAPPSLTVTPDFLSFSDPLVGQSSAPQPVTFQNIGNAAITLGTATIAGTNAGDFSISSDACSGISLAAGQTCVVNVVYKPPQSAEEFAYLSLGGGSGSVLVSLTGIGIFKPLLNASPSSLNFLPTTQQTASAPQTVTLTNNGNAAAGPLSVYASSPFTQTNNCGSSLAAGASCQISIIFRPTSATTFNQAVTVWVQGAAVGVTVPVSGTGVAAPAAIFCPSSLDFGNQVQGTPSSSQAVVLTNSGAAQLHVTSIDIGGDFSETDNCVGSVPARNSCAIQVTFTPTALGTRSGQITIYDDATGGPQIIPLTGNGVSLAQLEPPNLPMLPPDQQKATMAEARQRVVNAERPISFEPNQGQFEPEVQYVAHVPGYAMVLAPGQVVFQFPGVDKKAAATTAITLVGADPRALPVGIDPMPGKVSYLIGNDPKQWRTGIPTYARVRFPSVYRGVDLVYYGTDRQLEYDFIVSPRANPKNIRLKFDREAKLSVSADGDLLVSTPAGTMQLHKPVAYQDGEGADRSPGARIYRDARWIMKDASTAAFEVGSYDRRRTLVIDPVLSFSTYFGGFLGDAIRAITLDSAGNIYVAGQTGSPDFPVSPNALKRVCGTVQNPCAPNFSVTQSFVAKLSADGSTILAATYLGGSYGQSEVDGIALDATKNIYVAGSTGSPDFPVTPNAFQTSHRPFFVSKLDPTLSSLIYSTYLGGTSYPYPGDAVTGIGVDSQGNAVVVGGTSAADFPLTPGAFATYPPLASNSRGFATKFNASGTGLVFSTYIGGSSGFDRVGGVALDTTGNIYVTGQSNSIDFPTTPGAFQTGSYGGDAFVTKFAPSGSVVYSTLIGGGSTGISPINRGNGIAVDSSGAAYVAGSNQYGGFPVTPGAFRSAMDYRGSTGFLAKLHPLGCALTYGTYTQDQFTNAIAIDGSGDAYVIGTVDVFPLPTTPQVPGVNALQPVLTERSMLVSEYDPTGSQLLFSTPYGGSSDAGYPNTPGGIAVDNAGNIFIAGGTEALDLPIRNAIKPDCPNCRYNYSLTGGGFAAKIDPHQTATGVSLTRNELTFSPMWVNVGRAQTLGLMNNQNVPLNIQSVSVSGAGFMVDGWHSSCTGSVMPGGGCIVVVAFAPTVLGPIQGVLTIVDDGPGSPRQVVLNGMGSSPANDHPPQGAVDRAVNATTLSNTLLPGGTLLVSGWAVDTDSGAPVGEVVVNVDGMFLGKATLGQPRSDIANYYKRPDFLNSGWSLSAPIGNLTPGNHTVSVVAYDADSNPLMPPATLGNPITFTVGSHVPQGAVDQATNANNIGSTSIPPGGTLLVSGWAVDLDSPAPVGKITVSVDGTPLGDATLGQARSDIANYFKRPDFLNSGWSFTAGIGNLAPGNHTVTVVAYDADTPGIPATTIGSPLTFTVANNPPQGAVDRAVNANNHATNIIPPGGSLLVSGWAIDLDGPAPVGKVTVSVDGTPLGDATLGQARSDIANYFKRPDLLNSGWSLTAPIGNLAMGDHTVTVVAYDADVAGVSTSIGSLTITVGYPANHPPQGAVDRAVNDSNHTTNIIPPGGSLLVSGWAVDMDSPAPVAQVTVNIDGVPLGNATLGQARSDIANYYQRPDLLNSGWSLSAPIGNVALGNHTVTVVAYDADAAGVSATIGSPLTITVGYPANHPPQGAVDRAVNDANHTTNIIPPGGSLLVSGWAVDMDSPAPVAQVTVNIDGVPLGNATLGQARSDIANYYNRPDLLNSGWSLSAPIGNLAMGDHTVTVVASDADAPGVSATIGSPLTITVGYPANHAPQGAVDQAVNAANHTTNVIPPGGSLLVSGWAVDMDSPAPVAQVTVNIDGTPIGNATLGQARSDIANYYNRPDLLNSGWSLSAPLPSLVAGNHTVTVVAYDADAPGVSAQIGSPLTITIGYPGDHPPQGAVDQATNANQHGSSTIPQGGTLLVSGWAVDMDSPAPVAQVTVNIDGVPLGNATLGQPRSDISNYFKRPDLLNCGWSLSASIGNLAPGNHTVTVVAYDADAPGVWVVLGPSFTLTVP